MTRAQGLAESLRAQALVRDDEATFPLDSLKDLADAGLMGVNVRPEYGGLGAGVVAYSLAVSTIAAADPAVAVTMAVNNMVNEVIQQFGTDDQRQHLIPAITSGEFSCGSFCLSEPGSGSDAAGMRTRATRTDDGWSITGAKAWITSGAYAGIFLVWASTGPPEDRAISLFAVPADTPGITVGNAEEKMGQHASNTVALSFDDVKIPADSIVGEPGMGFPIAMMALDGGRIGIASQSLGIADAARSIAEDLGLTDGLHELDAALEAARSITWRAAWLKEQGDRPFSREASVAKLMASEVAGQWAAELYRRLPASSDSAFEDHRRFAAKLLRDVRVTRIYEGTSEIQRIVIARDLIRRASP